jgi:CubicO group peptidase (beta-lactamase class C family)
VRRPAAVLGALAIAVAARLSAAPPSVEDALQRVLDERRQALHIPGLAFVAVKDGEVVALKGLGLRDLDRKLPVTPGTLFPIGSCTKAFTALAAAAAQDDGLLTLDDRPHRFLSYFKLQDPEAEALVTLRDMLSHRGGLKAYADLAAEPGVLTREEYVRAATGAKPVAPLRSKFQYSNAMYVAVGEAVAAAARTSWEGYVERRLFTPLGMAHSVASAGQVAAAADHATGYAYDAATGSFTPVPIPASLDALGPAGSIASTASDLGRWLRFLIGKGQLDGRRVVSERAWREVTTRHMTMTPALSYALGWALYDWNGRAVVEHNGGSQGISALVSFAPEERVGFALVANSSPTSLTKIGEAGKLLWPILIGSAAASPPAVPDPAPPPAVLPAGGPAAAPAPPLPSVDELLPRMIAAAGGELNIRRHRTMEARYDKRYLNHGVEADVWVRAKAPDRWAEDEAWSAVGKRIAEFRVRFDGAVGGQETTFGQDSVYEGRELGQLQRRARLQGLLELPRTYDRLSVRAGPPVGEEQVVVLAARSGDLTDMFHVSTRTYLVLKTEKGAETSTFSDFRNVDGVVLPHAIHVQDVLGETTLALRSVRFDVPIPDEVFRLKRPPAAAKRAS